ncbi:hypothetical protein [Nostoc sp. DedQUE09]|uniref:hypothetical protein n=1 Tax=Nostoc sp. DedQUE09 TaxID=3075394 RepID=UPI003A0FCAAB
MWRNGIPASLILVNAVLLKLCVLTPSIPNRTQVSLSDFVSTHFVNMPQPMPIGKQKLAEGGL